MVLFEWVASCLLSKYIACLNPRCCDGSGCAISVSLELEAVSAHMLHLARNSCGEKARKSAL